MDVGIRERATTRRMDLLDRILKACDVLHGFVEGTRQLYQS